MKFFSCNLLALSVALIELSACGNDDNNSVTQPETEYSSAQSPLNLNSSSGAKNGASSSKASSSSTVPSNYDAKKGILKDERDGQEYKTVKIGNQIWMAENLNLEFNGSNCFFSNNGCYYWWSEAMDSLAIFSPSSKGCGRGSACAPTGTVRGICPEGWHLPTKAEFETLFAEVGGQSTAGKMLKSKSGWKDDRNGTDAYGFNAFPEDKDSDSDGKKTILWTSTSINDDNAFAMALRYTYNYASLVDEGKYYMLNVRCLMDSDSPTSKIPAESSSSTPPPSNARETSTSSSSTELILAIPCKNDKSDTCEYGTLTDKRDGQTYKTVVIGKQTWMAENLNYEVTNSRCYKDELSNCEKYGMLYSWSTAMDSSAVYSSNGTGCGFKTACSPVYPVRGICPEGWHLPSENEFTDLITAIGGEESGGQRLKTSSGWNKNGNGVDAFGFSALPAGFKLQIENFDSDGKNAIFWSSTQSTNLYAIIMYIDENNEIRLGTNTENYGVSVRCLKD